MPEMINKRNVRICLLFITLGFYVVMFAQDQTVKTQQDFDQKAALAKLREQIKGRENEPAEQVFKNIQSLKGVPAGRLLAIMAGGYARSLGVNCTHCHVPDKWESDEKRTKPIAREMAAMTKTINTELLKNIKNLSSATPTVNCTTCHRGQVTPALNLPTPAPSPATANTAISNH